MATPSKTTIKRLFALSGNQCAFPNCAEKMIDESGTLIGEVCHICGDKLGSKRYEPTQTEAERQGFSNLILLCPKHHTMIDDDEIKFQAPVIKQMKKRHEEKATEPYVISDRMAERIILLLGGSIVGAALAEFAQGLGQVVGALANISGTSKSGKKTKQEETHEKALRRAGEILRYAPKGTFMCFGGKSIAQGVARFFASLFMAGGWRELKEEDVSQLTAPRLDEISFAMAFLLRDSHQVSKAKQAIDEVFHEFGFEIFKEGEIEVLVDHDHSYRALVIVAAH